MDDRNQPPFLRRALVVVALSVPLAVVVAVIVASAWHPPREEALFLPRAPGLPPQEALSGIARGLEQGIPPFRPVSAVKRFGPDELARYNDGAAPAFLEKGFRGLVVCDLSDGSDDFVAEVYHMGRQAGARAIFEERRSRTGRDAGETVAIGNGGYRSRQQLVFWRGVFFAKVVCFTGDPVPAIEALSKALDRLLSGTDDKS